MDAYKLIPAGILLSGCLLAGGLIGTNGMAHADSFDDNYELVAQSYQQTRAVARKPLSRVQPAGQPRVIHRQVNTSAAKYPVLRHARDPHLQESLESMLDEHGLEDEVEDRELALALVDITHPQQPRLAMANGDHMMYAASLPKIAILLGAFERIDQGKMDLDEDTVESLTNMIRFSSNTAASDMLDEVGGWYLTRLLESAKYGFYDRKSGGGLWVGKPYARSGAYRRDPLKNLSHAATVYQVARYYYLLETGRLVSPEHSKTMKDMLSRPGIEHKFVKGLKNARPGSQIFRKSGTWGQYHADSAIVERNGRRYIAVALAQDSDGGDWMSEMIVSMDDLIFRPSMTLALNR